MRRQRRVFDGGPAGHAVVARRNEENAGKLKPRETAAREQEPRLIVDQEQVGGLDDLRQRLSLGRGED